MRILVATLAAAVMWSAPEPTRPTDDVRIVRTWYADGHPDTERQYVGGRESGPHRGWWPTGRPRFVYNYSGGLLEGTSREWTPSGALYREQEYHLGHEAGLQRMYWEDGRVRASYVVRNGRRYGLMGAKGCIARDTLDVQASR